MSSERPSHSVVLADTRAVGIAALGQFSSYLAQYDKVSTYQYMPNKSIDDLSKEFGKNALEPINALLSSDKPEDQALGRESSASLTHCSTPCGIATPMMAMSPS